MQSSKDLFDFQQRRLHDGLACVNLLCLKQERRYNSFLYFLLMYVDLSYFLS